MKIDLHVHSKYSKDCWLELKDLLKVAQTRLDAIAITDHDTIRGGLEARRLVEEGEAEIKVIVGAEIKTNKGEVMGYGLEEEIAARDFWEVVDAIREQGGIVGVSHPFDSIRPHSLKPGKDILQGIDTVEVFNSRCILASFNEKAMKFAIENNLGMTAGSDAHTLQEIGRSGVVLDSLEFNPEMLRDAKIFGEKTSPLELIKTKFKKVIRP
ncbi:MAG: PHP domain-containing protein [Candidatus Hydrothermarchaeales archaeon]